MRLVTSKGRRRETYAERKLRTEGMRMEERKEAGLVHVDTLKKGFFWLLMLIGMVLVVYFTLSMIINMVFAADLAGEGVSAATEGGETITLHGISGWVAVFSPWLALNAYLLTLGTIFFGIGYVMTPKQEDGLAVSLFKMRILSWYLVLVVLLMVVLGTDRIFFLTSAAKEGALAWIDWYIFEYLAHIVWAVILAVLAFFFLRVGRKGLAGDEED